MNFALTCRSMDTGPLGESFGFWHPSVDGGSFESCGLRGWASMDLGVPLLCGAIPVLQEC